MGGVLFIDETYTLKAEGSGEGVKEELHWIFTGMYDTRDKNSGNGRDVRNFYDIVTSCMAERVIMRPETPDEEMMQITREDVQGAEKKRKANMLDRCNETGTAGF